MPWTTPTLRDVRKMTRDYVLSQLGAKAMIPNSSLRIMSDAQSGLAHLNLLYLDWQALQYLPDTSETEWLDRHGDIWLVNADGSKGRKAATFAKGKVIFTGVTGVTVPSGTLMNGTNGVQYQTTEHATISANGGTAGALALTAGIIGNLPDGEFLAMVSPIQNVTDVKMYGDMTGGVDTETDPQLRERVLRRIQQPPMGGDAEDYEAWALAVPGVTRAWCAPLEMGIGTVTLRFMMDDLRADNDGFPTGDDVATVEAYINQKRPVAVKDIFVVAPLKQPINVAIANLVPDTETVRGDIEASVRDMLYQKAAPGQTIFTAWKYSAVMAAGGVVSFDIVNTADDVMESPGHMAVLNDIIYDIEPNATPQTLRMIAGPSNG